MTGQAHPAYAVGVVMIAGGLMGYFRKGSRASLIAGLSFGAGYIASGNAIDNSAEFEGHGAAGVLGSVLGASMGIRTLSTGKVFPAGMIATIGCVSAAYHINKAIEWR